MSDSEIPATPVEQPEPNVQQAEQPVQGAEPVPTPEDAAAALAALEGPLQELDHAMQWHGTTLMLEGILGTDAVTAAKQRLEAAQAAHAAHSDEHEPGLSRKIDQLAQFVIDSRPQEESDA